MVSAGDEVGLEGHDNEDARRPLPWNRSRWDVETYSAYRSLRRLRHGHGALRRGGFRWVHRGTDTLVYLRETASERLLVQVSRAAHPAVALPAGPLGLEGEPLALLGEVGLRVAGGSVGGSVALPGDGPAAHVWASSQS